MTKSCASSASRSRRIASATIPRPVSSATKSATASAPPATKQSPATIAEKGRRARDGRKRLTRRTPTAPPRVTRIGESAVQSIVGVWNSIGVA